MPHRTSRAFTSQRDPSQLPPRPRSAASHARPRAHYIAAVDTLGLPSDMPFSGELAPHSAGEDLVVIDAPESAPGPVVLPEGVLQTRAATLFPGLPRSTRASGTSDANVPQAILDAVKSAIVSRMAGAAAGAATPLDQAEADAAVVEPAATTSAPSMGESVAANAQVTALATLASSIQSLHASVDASRASMEAASLQMAAAATTTAANAAQAQAQSATPAAVDAAAIRAIISEEVAAAQASLARMMDEVKAEAAALRQAQEEAQRTASLRDELREHVRSEVRESVREVETTRESQAASHPPYVMVLDPGQLPSGWPGAQAAAKHEAAAQTVALPDLDAELHIVASGSPASGVVESCPSLPSPPSQSSHSLSVRSPFQPGDPLTPSGSMLSSSSIAASFGEVWLDAHSLLSEGEAAPIHLPSPSDYAAIGWPLPAEVSFGELMVTPQSASRRVRSPEELAVSPGEIVDGPRLYAGLHREDSPLRLRRPNALEPNDADLPGDAPDSPFRPRQSGGATPDTAARLFADVPASPTPAPCAWQADNESDTGPDSSGTDDTSSGGNSQFESSYSTDH
ncbi:uncharacterized protein AMSG_03317 [Thecamonas trahens ATCC 50062]|uniref:Uncharacterized protein n=1 Tax=Thecamonas trahens ATCC 50062 TaxID=461836 RepID=A0A0L0D453_THETB|nr:hypothetical protein AMSG_03317 [Thecamonas trahens ATCC 50062]KNC46886.1 hypothetical protein AMSG_03317 [Thecamonas trahens ATCC 50062]|eukprot:XP_013760159.1 hypothetical protein AMSG_03317 [Thecamonas trahens ATCC 50062]